MRLGQAAGIGLILLGALLGGLLSFGLYQLESMDRAGRMRPPSPLESPGESTARSPALASKVSETATGDILAGPEAFDAQCAVCHPNRGAGVGPTLHGPQFNSKYSDDDSLKTVIRQGRGSMPPFPASSLSDEDLNAIVAYLRSLK
ncbi:MAG: cytochrome c [Chloroflexi bacterium]|nr:cytochrome c [Chloroflexota bacterium]